ncbi:MAG TPA: F0F1 ATP synthase subunit B [Ignavibacteriaceae bacterium]|nr:F0F1 ATP synthase subunit B [Ignavibacteriaceae bacterium]
MFANFTIAVLSSGTGGGGLLDVNPGLMIWTVITFIILLVVLKKVAWKPILTALDRREQDIRNSIEKAEKASENAQKILEENKATLAKAEEESKKIIEQSRAYAENLKDQLLKQSKEQARKIIEDSGQEIQRQKDAAFEELKQQIAEIAISAAEKIIKENVDAEKNKRIVSKYLDEVTKN